LRHRATDHQGADSGRKHQFLEHHWPPGIFFRKCSDAHRSATRCAWLANVRRHATFRDCGNPRMRICVGETERRKMTQCEK
jgi:hypothetical protein